MVINTSFCNINTGWKSKFMWLTVIGLSIITAAYMVNVAWYLSERHPTLTTLETDHYPIWNIPFPAITICNTNQVLRSRALELSKKMVLPKNVTHQQIFKNLQIVTQLLNPNIYEQRDDLTNLQETIDANNISVRMLTKYLAPQCEQLIANCTWKGRFVHNCYKMFQDITTTEGRCCAFNYNGYLEEVMNQQQSVPVTGNIDKVQRTSTCGFQMGLSLLLDNQPHEYHSTVLASKGVKIFIHNPAAYPSGAAAEVVISVGMQVFAGISAIQTYATDSVRDMPSKVRSCQFEDEGFSKVMKMYTYHNCYTECQKNKSVALCGCHSYHYPTTGTRRTCNFLDIPCLSKNRKVLQAIHRGKYDKTIKYDIEYNDKPCKCLPDCSSLIYTVETTTNAISTNSLLSSNLLLGNLSPERHSIIHIFFIDLTINEYRTDIFLEWQAFVATVGGILGLMLGFSLINGFEIVYFFTLRIFFHLTSQRKSNKKPTEAAEKCLTYKHHKQNQCSM
ncbi:sodium channel protein Nach-like [Schistocerca gregaria]|uniref:sodium channel protein Nach-like n=1 Tax=Schistocerca gregaria TaxID=7010 RepID=UPI00211DBF46|nr:sodium channel protein Nach-like [Schistocerca gregaria]